MLSEIVSTAAAPGTIVKVVDKYALDAEALKAIAPIAAGIPDSEIWILTEGKRYDAEAEQTAGSPDAEAFAAVATQISKVLRTKIRVFSPTIPLHDRFLQIGPRFWHVGHSFNNFGCDFSAIVEFRDPKEIQELHSVFDQQFVGERQVYG